LNDRYWRRRRRRRRGGWPWWRRRGGCHGHRRQHFDITTSTTSWFAIVPCDVVSTRKWLPAIFVCVHCRSNAFPPK
jgi:hypothetical protein